MTDKNFWKAVGIRALKTVCQAAIAMIGSGQIGILDVDWTSVLSVSAMAGLLSVLTSLAHGLPEVSLAQSSYMDAEEPLDSFIGDGEICKSIYTKREAEKDGGE